jgi:Flp pilus assembly protein protease CpaA
MKKIQKMGFIISNSIFILLGLIFLIVGIIAEDRTLKIMGAFWLPLGILSLLLVLYLIRKEK